MKEKEEIRVKIPSDIVIKLRIMKMRGNTFSSIVEKALKEFFEKSEVKRNI